MVNQGLVDWIKKGKSQGHTDQSLHDHLVQHGQDSHEVMQAINHVNHQPGFDYHERTTKRKSNIFLILIIILLLATGAVAFALYYITSNSTDDIKTTKDTQVKTQQNTQTDTKIVNCGSDLPQGGYNLEEKTCFHENLEKCSPATYTVYLLPEHTILKTIKGPEGDNCIINYKLTQNKGLFPSNALNAEMDCQFVKAGLNKDKEEEFWKDYLKKTDKCEGKLKEISLEASKQASPY